MAEIVRSIEIDVPVEHMYKVITDFEHLKEFVTGVIETHVEYREGENYRVRYKIKMIKDIEYTLNLKGTPPNRLEWSLVRGDMMKENKGAWELTPIGNDRTLATYKIDLQLLSFVPGAITKQLTEMSLPKMLQEFKKRAELTYKT